MILPDVPSATRSTVAMSATSIAVNGTATVTVTVRDRFGNVVKTAAPGDFALSASAGSFSAVTCSSGVCTATYTAPAAPGSPTISVKILGVDILGSPIVLTIM